MSDAVNPKPVTPKPAAPKYLIGSSPHIASPVNARRIMLNVLIALAPVTVFGVFCFGIKALINIVVAIAAAELSEYVFRKATKQDIRNGDLSAAITGLLLALVIPPATPAWMTALGAIFAIVVGKEFFGGLGANVFNPALIGRAFLLMSFPAALTLWSAPFGKAADAVSTATPLGALKEYLKANPDALSGASPHWFTYSGAVSGKIGDYSSYGQMIMEFFLGNRGGSLGETSALLILVGAVFLIATKTIDLRAPLAMLITTFILSIVVGLDPLVGLLSGGVLFGAVFMVTDYTTAPVTEAGKIVFGIGSGLITVLIRKFGNYPEGVMFSILIMNMVTPFLNRIIQKKYGYKKPEKKPAQQGAAK